MHTSLVEHEDVQSAPKRQKRSVGAILGEDEEIQPLSKKHRKSARAVPNDHEETPLALRTQLRSIRATSLSSSESHPPVRSKARRGVYKPMTIGPDIQLTFVTSKWSEPQNNPLRSEDVLPVVGTTISPAANKLSPIFKHRCVISLTE